MSPFDPTIDASFREYADLQLRRNALLTEGKEQDPEFDHIEDRMTELWETLDETQRNSANGMGSDLNWIRRKGLPAPMSRKAQEVSRAEQDELLAALQSNEWHRLLYYLRVCSPTILAANLAYRRGQAYNAIGFPSYSIGFYELAADLEPSNASLGVAAILALDQVNPARALSRAEHVLTSSVRYPMAVVAMSAMIALHYAEAEGLSIDTTRYRRILEDAIKRLPLEPVSAAGSAMVYQFVAFGFEIIGDLPSALKCYEEGLRLSPDNEILLICKGMLLYGNRTNEAVEAFRRVISNEGTALVWPYYYLAHYFLVQRNYDDSARMAQQAWERATTDPIRAELLEWQAICLSVNGYPPGLVRPWFEKAVSLDPSNERIDRKSVV